MEIIITVNTDYFSCTFEPEDDCFLVQPTWDDFDWSVQNVRWYWLVSTYFFYDFDYRAHLYLHAIHWNLFVLSQTSLTNYSGYEPSYYAYVDATGSNPNQTATLISTNSFKGKIDFVTVFWNIDVFFISFIKYVGLRTIFAICVCFGYSFYIIIIHFFLQQRDTITCILIEKVNIHIPGCDEVVTSIEMIQIHFTQISSILFT